MRLSESYHKSAEWLSGWQDLFLLGIRLLMGLRFIAAGIGKLFYWGSHGSDMATALQAYMEPRYLPLLVCMSLVECLGGVLVCIGWRTRWAAAGLTICVALYAVMGLRQTPPASITSELFNSCCYLALTVLIAVFGPGRFVVERHL